MFIQISWVPDIDTTVKHNPESRNTVYALRSNFQKLSLVLSGLKKQFGCVSGSSLPLHGSVC